MDYIKDFATHSDYETYMSGDKLLPNVSLCENENDVHYNIWPGISAIFNVTSTSSRTLLMGMMSESYFTEMWIDGVKQPSIVTSYTFDTTGEHMVKFTLANNTKIENNLFQACPNLSGLVLPRTITSIGNYAINSQSLREIVIPDKVTTIGTGAFESCGLTNIKFGKRLTTIGNSAFKGCLNLASVTIPKNITKIGSDAFYNCRNLVSVTIENPIPPSVGGSTFGLNRSGRKIYVPSESVNLYKSSFIWSNYASDIEPIPTT